MANKHPNSEITPANTDDALEGPQRIREIKQAYNERLGRDHLIGGITSPDVIAQGADSDDSGYHRRITIKEETSAQGGPADTRLNATSTGINHSTTAKMAEVWMEKHSGTADETSMLFLGTEGTGNQRTVVTTTQTQTLTNKTLTAATLTNPTLSGGSGAIDGVAVGTTTEAAGKFTTLESTGNTIIGNSDTADTLTVKATTSGLSSDASGFAGANKMYAGIAGEIKLYAGSVLPAGWLWCDGAQYEKTAKAELYAAIGDAYNAPGNSTSSGTYANFISNSSWFRIPDLRGRTPVGSGTGEDSHTVAGAAGLHPTDNLTARTLGDYGANEAHTLTAGESGAGPHYHKTVPDSHIHQYELWHHNPPGATYYGNQVQYVGTDATVWSTKPTLGTTSTITASADLTTESESEADGITRESAADAAAFRLNKTDLNLGVKAASGHTQMQPWLAINYIIKY